jgi:hypothetical protein
LFHWNLECHEEDFPWEVFPSLSSFQHKKINMWDLAISWGNTLWILTKIWAIVHSMSSLLNTQSTTYSILLGRANAYWVKYHWWGKWSSISR